VYELTNREGRVAAVVLKAAKAGALISNIQREWAVGQKVTSLQDEKGYLPGFMKVDAVILRRSASASSCPDVTRPRCSCITPLTAECQRHRRGARVVRTLNPKIRCVGGSRSGEPGWQDGGPGTREAKRPQLQQGAVP
jgi:hypothetical protein